ncbi:hypothetical protein ACPA9J_10110 [Pseudomonas aeruginosa]
MNSGPSFRVRLSPSAESVRAVLKAFDEGDVIEHLPRLGALDGGAVDRIDAEGIADAIDSNLSLDPPLGLQEPWRQGRLGLSRGSCWMFSETPSPVPTGPW